MFESRSPIKNSNSRCIGVFLIIHNFVFVDIIKAVRVLKRSKILRHCKDSSVHNEEYYKFIILVHNHRTSDRFLKALVIWIDRFQSIEMCNNHSLLYAYRKIKKGHV